MASTLFSPAPAEGRDSSLLRALLGVSTVFGGLVPRGPDKQTSGPRGARTKGNAAGSGDHDERIFVLLANSRGIRELLGLAFAIRARKRNRELHPLLVASEGPEQGPGSERTRELLAEAGDIATESKVPLAPAIKLDEQDREGMLAVAEDCPPSILLLGWDRAPRPSKTFFGGGLGALARKASALVVLARLPRPLAATNRFILVLPPGTEEHPGLGRGVSVLQGLLPKLGGHLTVYAERAGIDAIRSALSGIRLRGLTQFVELDSWKRTVAELKKSDPNPGQVVFIVLCSRPGGPAWHPAVDKLPHSLALAFPDVPLLLFCLPDAGEGSALPQARVDLFARALAAGRVMPAMEETAITDGIRALLRRAFGSERKTLGKLVLQFTELAQKEPIELAPGIVLLHARVVEAKEALLFFGARPEGFRLLALEEPVRILVILCAPEGQSPEAHLALLGELAHAFRDEELARRLLAATSIADLMPAGPGAAE